MTYEEREKAICKECTDYNTSKCPYVIRSLRCPNLLNQMDGWELGYKDAIDKAFDWLIERYENQGVILLEDINEFKQRMEEQQ